MLGVDKMVPCAAVAAVLLAGSSRIVGQAPVENGRSFGIAASEDALPDALNRVDTMLGAGQLDIASVVGRQDDRRPIRRALVAVL